MSFVPRPCQAGFWAFDDLTYAYDDMFDSSLTTAFPIEEREAALEEGLEVWTNDSNLTFTQVALNANPNIIISHADFEGSFLGQGTIVGDNWTGQATSLLDDSNRNWSKNDFRGVLAHEIGHNLGIGHWEGATALMNSGFTTAAADQVAAGELFAHDIQEVQSRHGTGTGFVRNARHWNGPDGGDWRSNTNWQVAPGAENTFQPSHRSDVKINQSSVTLLAAAAIARAGSLEVGQSGAGRLEIQGATLNVSQAEGVVIHGSGTIHQSSGWLLTDVLRFGADGTAPARFQVDAGLVNVFGDVVDDAFQSSLEIRGGQFTVSGDLNFGGNLVSDPNSHPPIQVGGGVTLQTGAALTLEFGSGVTPMVGDSWTLISGSTGITGSFSSITGPAVGSGLGYKASAAGGDLSVSVSSVMTLKVNRTTGAASLNGGAQSIDMELYAIGSPGGHLTPGTWVSLDAAGFDSDSWLDGNPAGNVHGLAEARANPLGSSTFGAAQVQAIGSILNTTGLTFGESRDDLTFSYLEPGSTIFTNGIVEYEGPHNNMVLVVDPATGDAVIHNQSAFDATINLYAISSESGALLHDPSETVGVGWDSFEETGVDGGVWQRGSGSAQVLVEANPASATLISSGAQINLGTPWDMTTQDLTFEFLLEGDSIFTQGIVEYSSIISIPGDFNDDGRVDGGDFLTWQRAHPSSFDLADWEANYGNGVISSGSTAAVVPEPASLILFALGALAAIAGCRSRNGGLLLQF